MVASIITTAVTALVGAVVSWLVGIVLKKLSQIKKEIEAIKGGNQASLRHNLLEIYDYWNPKGYCPREYKNDFENLYKNYHKLGANGVMTSYYIRLKNLPDKKENKIK